MLSVSVFIVSSAGGLCWCWIHKHLSIKTATVAVWAFIQILGPLEVVTCITKSQTRFCTLSRNASINQIRSWRTLSVSLLKFHQVLPELNLNASLSYLTFCRTNFLFDSLEDGGELKDGCMTGCHSALNPTSVPSLCISITRVLRHWPAPINPLGERLSSLPCPALPSLCSPPLPFSRYLSAFLISPLPACPSLVLHSGNAPHLHCGCQSEGRREEWRLRSV